MKNYKYLISSLGTLLGDFNAKVGTEDIFKPTISNESLHEASNDNGIRVVNFATSKHLIVKSTTFPYRDIHKHTWTSANGVTHNQIEHIFIDKRRHSNTLDIGSFRELTVILTTTLTVAKFRERISVSKRARQKSDLERFDLKKLEHIQEKERYHVEISNRFPASENLR
jgi:hypothetical protein